MAFASRRKKKIQKWGDLFLFVYKQVEFTSSFIIITQNHIKRQSQNMNEMIFYNHIVAFKSTTTKAKKNKRTLQS